MNTNTILIVDDTISNLDILVEILKDYDIVEATNGQDALEILQEENIDLILLDIMMPHMDGYETCSLIKNNVKTSNIPIIFLTAMTDESAIEKAYQVGGYDYITKPFKPKELISRVKTQLYLHDLQKKETEYNKQMALSELINNIAHHWRQPLSSISTLASGITLQKEFGILKDEEMIKSCKDIVRISQTLSSTIDTFSNFIEDKQSIYFTQIQTMIDKHFNALFLNIDDAKNRLIFTMDNALQQLEYSQKLIKVIHCLLENSKDAFEEVQTDPYIFINFLYKNEQIHIEYYDSALGTSEDDVKKIFEPYYTSKHKTLHKGMSLYLVRNIVYTIFKGTIEVKNYDYQYNEKNLKGLRFDITLPYE